MVIGVIKTNYKIPFERFQIPKMKEEVDAEPVGEEITTPSKKDNEGAVNLKSKTTLASGGNPF